MTFKTMQKLLGKPTNDLTRLIRGKNIGGRSSYSNREVWEDFYDGSDFEVTQKYLKYTKDDYIRDVENFIAEHPFCIAQDITDFLSRPASYTWWILTEMALNDPPYPLAETDDEEYFILSKETMKLLAERGDLW